MSLDHDWLPGPASCGPAPRSGPEGPLLRAWRSVAAATRTGLASNAKRPRFLVASIAAALICFGPASVWADDSDAGRYYNGSSLVGGILAGPRLLAEDYDGRLGYGVGAFVRFNTVMTVFAAQLQYEFGENDVRVGGDPVALRRHGLTAAVQFHPLFLRLLTNNYFWFVLTAWYVEAGAGADITILRGDTEAAGTLLVGSGIELPLDDPDDEGAFWLGVGWRWRFVLMDVSLGGHDDLHAHAFNLWLAYRWNNTSFTRVKRPPELKWR